MSITEVDPSSYFPSVQLRESTLVRFRMRPSQSRLDFVVIYAAEAIATYFSHLQTGGSPKDYECKTADFRLFQFLGVDLIHTKLGPNVPDDRSPKGNSDSDWEAHETTLLTPRRRTITGFDCGRSKSGYECRVYFDSFGEHGWTFERLLVDRVLATISLRDGQFEYRDASIGDVVDPSNPFIGEVL